MYTGGQDCASDLAAICAFGDVYGCIRGLAIGRRATPASATAASRSRQEIVDARAFQFAIRIDSIRFVVRIDSNRFVLLKIGLAIH